MAVHIHHHAGVRIGAVFHRKPTAAHTRFAPSEPTAAAALHFRRLFATDTRFVGIDIALTARASHCCSSRTLETGTVVVVAGGTEGALCFICLVAGEAD